MILFKSLKQAILFGSIFILLKFVMEGLNTNFIEFIYKNAAFFSVLTGIMFLLYAVINYLKFKKNK